MVWAVLNEPQNKAVAEITKTKSDRIIAVVGGAILEDSLCQQLKSRLRPSKSGNTDINEKLFRPAGPLGAFVPKIDLGYQLYMLDKPARNAMYGIAEIRNLFAHNLDMSFKDKSQKMADAIGKMTLHEERTLYPSPFWDGDSTHRIEAGKGRRHLFLINLKLCLIWLMADSRKHLPYSNVSTNVRIEGPKAA